MMELARSLERIERNDLLRLAALAEESEAGLFARHPDGAGRYARRLLCRALCQGAALHYLDGTTGVKDFDVWSFYAALDDGPFPYRWRGTADYGPSRFGRYPGDPPSFTGRRVDLLGRSLPVRPDADPTEAVRAFLATPRTETARALATKAVILISPKHAVGTVCWTPGHPTSGLPITVSQQRLALTNGIVAIAGPLGIAVVAEGIETAEQCKLLTAMGCQYGQGYLLARPMSWQEAQQLLRANQR